MATVSGRSKAVLFETPGLTLSGLEGRPDPAAQARDYPLVIALHGGTYTSRYFDVPGYSLLDRASALGIHAIALDRPGYGRSTPLPPAQAEIATNAEKLDAAIGAIWETCKGEAPGIFVIGHSIGGAITVSIAARRPAWPLLGIAISGVCLETPAESKTAWDALPDIPMILLPSERKDQLMLGPPAWTHTPDMPAASHVADTTVPRAELIDIVHDWPARVRDVTQRVTVPVHYRQGEFDPLWITDAAQVAEFGRAFTGSRDVDARLMVSAGHCIDFHRLGAAFQLDQLAFALRCAVRPPQA